MTAPKSFLIATDDDATMFAGNTEDWESATGPKTVGSASLTQALYLTESGDIAPISYTDIHQGQLGDCYLLSSIGELAMRNAGAIQNMIKVNADGTETVTMYLDRSGTIPTPGDANLKPVSVTINNSFATNTVNNGATQDVLGTQKEIWPQVLEKAFATMEGGYNAIANGGNPAEAMEELTGKTANFYSPTSLSALQLTADAQAGDLITFDTANSSHLADNLIADHAYMFVRVLGAGAYASVQLANPWGMDQPSLIPISQLAKNFVEIDVGRTV